MDLMHVDRMHIWHPYSAVDTGTPVYPVREADGVWLTLTDERRLLDGMSSWWCAIHGYNHPVLNRALERQAAKMSHVMFGGLTHEPAAMLVEQLVAVTPSPLQSVFLADSGSVSVEAAMKMAIQYWHAKGLSGKTRFVTPRGGYHGDTLHAMSVCDPVTGMHTLFQSMLPQQVFVTRPGARFGEAADELGIGALEQVLIEQHEQLAAMILEPIVQGAGGMWFYSADYVRQARALCDRYGVLLIADEIATGFGRTGKLFACEHADISPDIMCVGKALTGGYMTLAAVLTTREVSGTISCGHPGVFMHGPTFMANPLACAVASASIGLLLESPWQSRVAMLEMAMRQRLEACRAYEHVADVRVLGAIGVVELTDPVDMAGVQPMFVERGVWVRPFGRLIYLMPPFVMGGREISTLCDAVVDVVRQLSVQNGVAVPNVR